MICSQECPLICYYFLVDISRVDIRLDRNVAYLTSRRALRAQEPRVELKSEEDLEYYEVMDSA